MNAFDEITLRKLERLRLVAENVRIGRMKGDRRSRKRGSSIEFADYRDYTKGDDLRRLDWNVYARLDRPFVKLLEEEEDLAIHLLIDGSASMQWLEDGSDAENKLTYALRLAGALGYIGLWTNDLVQVEFLNSQGNRHWGPHRGRAHSMRLFQFLDAMNGDGITNLNLWLRDYALRGRGRRAGLLILISDLLSPDGYRGGLNSLLSRGYELGLVHVMSPAEVNPQFGGDLKLIDVETGHETEISLDIPMANLYRRRFEAWRDEIAIYCRGIGIHYIPVVTSIPWERLVLRILPQYGVLK